MRIASAALDLVRRSGSPHGCGIGDQMLLSNLHSKQTMLLLED
jgi:hypothetical protein